MMAERPGDVNPDPQLGEYPLMAVRIILPVFTLLAVLAACSAGESSPSADVDALLEVRDVSIEVDEDEVIRLDGNTVSLADLEERLYAMSRENMLRISIHPDPSVTMGVIRDVQRAIPDQSIAEILFVEPRQ